MGILREAGWPIDLDLRVVRHRSAADPSASGRSTRPHRKGLACGAWRGGPARDQRIDWPTRQRTVPANPPTRSPSEWEPPTVWPPRRSSNSPGR
jgi:hypothetical protein